jgi:hypothetical protein
MTQQPAVRAVDLVKTYGSGDSLVHALAGVFQLLRRSSQHLNLKLRTMAQDIVDTGTVPDDRAATEREVPRRP